MLIDDGYVPPLCSMCLRLMVRAPNWDHHSRTGSNIIVFACHDCGTVSSTVAAKAPLPLAA